MENTILPCFSTFYIAEIRKGKNRQKKHTNLVLDHESTDSRSGTFYFV